MSQLRFAIQSADLLRVLHDQVGVIHLDLRLDNFVITDRGVGFVDFGSAVRVGEDLRESHLLRSLFDEMLSTSQVQRCLGRMKSSGIVTSHFLANAHGKVDKAADVFYLAVQLCQPHGNPDLRPLIRFDPKSQEAHLIRRVTRAVLRPADPARPTYTSAASILAALQDIKTQLRGGPPATLPDAAPIASPADGNARATAAEVGTPVGETSGRDASSGITSGGVTSGDAVSGGAASGGDTTEGDS
jgi:serine/threonine protein kinase